MNALQDTLTDYLSLRRSLGYSLETPGRCLQNFVAFAASQGTDYVTTDLALRWVRRFTQVQPATRAARLGMVRNFAAWCQTVDPRTEVPPAGLLPQQYRRSRPYIYSDDEVLRIIAGARQLKSKTGLRAHAYGTLFGLLAVTGLRVSEAAGLDREDVDLDEGVLTVRRAKLDKTRLVPVHASTLAVLRGYASRRDQILGPRVRDGFFLSDRGRRITGGGARYNFAKVSREIGLREPVGGYRHGRGPRLHDLRHRFAVRTLIAWYRAGRDAEVELPKLATYLGHVHVTDTYWYLEAVPELLALATERLANWRGGLTV